jgi:hypothetical protein
VATAVTAIAAGAGKLERTHLDVLVGEPVSTIARP